jgi:hypothetical protein
VPLNCGPGHRSPHLVVSEMCVRDPVPHIGMPIVLFFLVSFYIRSCWLRKCNSKGMHFVTIRLDYRAKISQEFVKKQFMTGTWFGFYCLGNYGLLSPAPVEGIPCISAASLKPFGSIKSESDMLWCTTNKIAVLLA